MSDQLVGFWFIVSKAIDSFKLPNDNDSNGVNDMDEISGDMIDSNVNEEIVNLLSSS